MFIPLCLHSPKSVLTKSNIFQTKQRDKLSIFCCLIIPSTATDRRQYSNYVTTPPSHISHTHVSNYHHSATYIRHAQYILLQVEYVHVVQQV